MSLTYTEQFPEGRIVVLETPDGKRHYGTVARANDITGCVRVFWHPAFTSWQVASSIKLVDHPDADVAALKKALENMVDDEPCWHDHHGYCQEHGDVNPCPNAEAKALLKRLSPA